MKALETVTVETGPDPAFTIIWMHGLGADGHDFEPLVPELLDESMPVLRFVFPHAPVRPVTINNGYAMRAWYDIIGIDRRSAEDFAGIKASAAGIAQLIERENQRGIPTSRIALAGFSQGGAMALHLGTRHAEKLAGVIALSCYLPLGAHLVAEKSPANQATPFFMAHGTQDPVVPHALGEESRRALEAAGYAVEWHSYAMPHSLCEPEVGDIRAFLARIVG
ncbi:MAG TPA: dienelactone hydrolase family protein [Steroidobacteraceae bacterium]|nr:dienelactone hydrolase family protein [Steroidobacteraceae bacterium]